MPEKVCIIGSGNWGSAIARIVGSNAAAHEEYENSVSMWVYEEMVDGRKLTEIINTDHENVKYLKGYKLPENVVAVPELADAVKGATILIFVLPHQFLPRLLPTVKANMTADAKAISLIKGIDFDEKGLVLISNTIRNGLGIDVSVLMGANVAKEVADDDFCETTIGYTAGSEANGKVMHKLFNTPLFQVTLAEDAAGVELCGALKNIVAIGAGFCDGLNFGGNTKAAIIRIGLVEMMRFCKKFYKGVKESTFFESCGVADLITTCYGGRNRKCAAAFAESNGTRKWDDIEAELLGGQKLQGTLTAKEVHEVLVRVNAVQDFPLFTKIYNIAYEGHKVNTICDIAQPVTL
jgi:glycerol-3-phosphate dehydrogenase (NAD+)